MTSQSLEIHLFADFVCPWCYIGSERLEKVLKTFEAALEVRLTYHPFLLNPDVPPEGLDLQQMLRQKYGADPKSMFARVEAEAHRSGLALDLLQQPFTYSTVAAHTLMRQAPAKKTERALAHDLYSTYFVEHRNISDPEVLIALAVRHGFTAEEAAKILADPREQAQTLTLAQGATAQGIRGVPLYVINQRALSGAQPEDALRAAISEAVKDCEAS
jgi:predicted DsbA family dithiol-disulfide isomerase